MIVPLIVGRWWVVLALDGPLAFLAYWQVTGHHVYADGEAPPLNVESIAGFVWLTLWFWLLVGVRKVWEAYAVGGPLDRGRVGLAHLHAGGWTRRPCKSATSAAHEDGGGDEP